jgi:hypothetical protein
MFQIEDEDDIPQDLLNFLYSLQGDYSEWQEFWQTYYGIIWENDQF